MEKMALIEFYEANAGRFGSLADKEKRVLSLLSLSRLIVFTGGIILAWAGFTRSVLLGSVLLAGAAAFFLFLLKKYTLHTGGKEHLENLEKINNDEALALSGDYSAFGDGSRFADPGHDFTFDIDIFGKSSFFQYLNRTSTGYGCEILADWLSNPYAQVNNLISRQEIVKEIAGKPGWRQEFLATGMNKNLDRKHILGLLAWLNDEASMKNPEFIGILIWLFPSVSILALALVFAGILHYSIFISLFLAGLFITVLFLKKTNAIHNELTGRFRFLSSLGKLLYLFEKEQFNSQELIKIQSCIRDSAIFSLTRLSRIIHAFDNRMNVLVGFVLNGLLLWDLHCVQKLNRWKSGYRNSFAEWLSMLGRIDAFVSLGNYSFNHHDFAWPVSSDKGIIMSAGKLGHQLIDEGKRVCNDFTLPAKGSICIISGANMAGKSTFLRTVTVNYIMAMIGAPVCAEAMTFTPMKLFTSMRTTDSLSTNESYFYAGLRRLRLLQAKMSEGDNILFILDEILKGTNSEDKSIGSRLFLKKLIGLMGTGLIATHDTSLGTLQEEFPKAIINKCIEIEIDGEIIRFDYLLRDGITTKKNAVLLMKQMGILD
jgi:hypothetical protein